VGPRLEGLAVGRSGVLVAWSWEEVLVGVPGSPRLERVEGLPRSHAVAVLDDGAIVVATDDGLHVRRLDGVHEQRRAPLASIDRIAVTNGRMLLVGREGVAIERGRNEWRIAPGWLGSLSRAHVRGSLLEVLHVESMSCVGSWTVRTSIPLDRVGRAPRVERPFPDEQGRDGEHGIPDSHLASLDWHIGAHGWLYASDGTHVHALRGSTHRRVRLPMDLGSRLFRVGHDGQRTLALDGPTLLELGPRRLRVLDRHAPLDATALAIDGEGRPLIAVGRDVLRFRDGAWTPLASPCAPVGDRP
jgi:hypothetical protein